MYNEWTKNRFCLIGNSQLLLDCLDTLLNQKYPVLAIISADEKVNGWVSSYNRDKSSSAQIQLYASIQEFISSFHDSFDYLLSIANYTILPNNIINMPKHGVVNYHTGKLPQYRGVYGSSWAIVNQEDKHAITWHIIDEGIDTGSILLQHDVEVEATDTALTLEIKCAVAAKETFPALLSLLRQDELKTQPQDNTQAHTYTFNNKLPGHGLINWHQDAIAILRIHRATVMSEEHPNYLGVTKFLLLGELYTAKQIKLTSKTSKQPPGSIIEISVNTLEVATKTTNVLLEGIYTLKGKPINAEQLLSPYQGAYPRLDFDARLAGILEKNEAYNYKHERFWRHELEVMSPIIYPGSNARKNFSLSTQNSSSYISLQTSFSLGTQESPETKWLIALFILFYKLSPQKVSTIGFIEPNPSPVEDLFLSNKIPLTLEFDNSTSLGTLRERIVAQLDMLKKHGRYPYDIVFRHSELRDLQTDLPISIEITDNNESLPSITDSLLHFVINRTTGEATCYYHPDLVLDAYFLNEMPNYWQHIVEQLSKLSEDVSVNSINIITATQKQKLLSKQLTALKSPPLIQAEDNIVKLFEKICNTADINQRIALRYRDNGITKTLTYEELNRKVNLIAATLQDMRLSQDRPVLVACQRAEEFIASVLAILKVGRMYVPINPCDTPEEFFQQMFQDLGEPIIITDENSIAFLPQKFVADKIIINTSTTLKTSDLTLIYKPIVINGNNPAYIIYTSGSTGKPNGVVVSHNSLLYSTRCRIEYYQNEVQDQPAEPFNILPLLSLSFDAATGAIFWALCSGNTLNLLDSESKSPEIVVSLLNEYQITHIMTNPSTYNNILLQIDKSKDDLDSLSTVILGGEKLDGTIILHHKKHVPNTALYDEYGPTENTVWTTVKRISKKGSRLSSSQSTIGLPLTSDIKVYILNNDKQLVPQGSIGELYITGSQVAKGYINREDVTALRFVKLNLAEIFNEPSLSVVDAYKTGDLVRYTSQRDLEYVGRIDDESKVNGHRIDLTGIIGNLKKISKVQDASVLLMQNARNSTCELIAFVVTDLPYTPKNVAQIQEALSHQLPNYMIPRKISFLSALPITRNGKVDKKKLLSMPYEPPTTISNDLKPSNAVEQTLASIWSGILRIGVDQLSTDVNLHDYGLKSIAIPRARMQIYNQFQVQFSLPEFFQYTTIQEQAEVILERIQAPTYRKSVLLTGATGFLGLHLLLEIFNKSDSIIYCLIRGNKQQNIKQKLLEAMQVFDYNSEILNSDRIILIEGDVSKPDFGLAQESYSHLTREIDVVFHCAAQVNHLLSAQQLYAANVQGTQNIADFSLIGKNKQLHYVSTLSVSEPNENFIVDEQNLSLSGYALSKRKAEVLLSSYREKGLHVTIYRPSWIGGHSQSGKFLEPNKDHLLCLTRACVKMGFAPDWGINVDMLPVDIVSKMIFSFSLSPESDFKVYNIFNPKSIPWKNYIKMVEEASGQSIQLLPKQNWVEKLRIEFLYPEFPLSPFKDIYLKSSQWLNEQEIQPPFSCGNTIEALMRLEIQILPISPALLARYLEIKNVDHSIIDLPSSDEFMNAVRHLIKIHKRSANGQGAANDSTGFADISPSSRTSSQSNSPPSAGLPPSSPPTVTTPALNGY